MKKTTTKEFISKAKAIHGDKYDYSKVEYKNSKIQVCIICPKHGEFWQKPNDHLMGHGCRKCHDEKNKLTLEEFIQRAREVHGDKYDYSKVKYENNDQQVCIICPKHGEFWQTPQGHLRGYGCKKCGSKKRMTTEKFIQRAREVHGDKYDYSKVEYIGSKANVRIICPIHGEFEQIPSTHLKGCGCPKCVGKKITTEEFIERSKKIHGDKYDYSKVKYKNTVKKVCIICPTHGEFWQSPKHHLQGQGCSKCNEPKLEKEIREFLEENGIVYVKNCNCKYFKWLGKQHLDFYLPEYNIAIECQGEEHFKGTNFGSKTITNEEAFNDVLKRDKRKKKLCFENNVKLLYYSNLGISYPYTVLEDKNYLLREINNGRRS